MGHGGDDKHLSPEQPMLLRVVWTERLGVTKVDKVAMGVDNITNER